VTRPDRDHPAPEGLESPPRPDRTALEVLWLHVWFRGVAYLLLTAFLIYLLVTQRHVYGLAL
jgi:hypothetical protein